MRSKTITVFGASGFLGRHLVHRLARLDATVRVPTRHPERAIALKTMGNIGQIVLDPWDGRRDDLLPRLLQGSDHVVNLIGILAEARGGDFKALQGGLPGKIGAAAAAAGVESLVHVSAIGADANSKSLYARTKAEGEAGLRASFPKAVILRPSIIFGPEDAFFNRFARMAQLSPALPLIGGGKTRFQPVYVGDVADAIAKGLTDPACAGRTFELGGPAVHTFRELMEIMLRTLKRRRLLVPVPFGVASLQGRLLQLLPEPPLTADQVELLKSDNVVGQGQPGLAELGILPTPLQAVLPGYLRPYGRHSLSVPVA